MGEDLNTRPEKCFNIKAQQRYFSLALQVLVKYNLNLTKKN